MGNYVFNTQTLIDIVTPNEESPLIDMGGDVIPALTAQGQAHVYDFSTNVVPGQDERERGYWRDVGTLDVVRRKYGSHCASASVQPLQPAVAGIHLQKGATSRESVTWKRGRAGIC